MKNNELSAYPEHTPQDSRFANTSEEEEGSGEDPSDN